MNRVGEKKWIYIPLGVLIFMCLGTIYSWSVFDQPLEKMFEVGATESGLPYMAFLASYAIVMPIAGGYIDKYGPKLLTIIGGAIVALGWILSGFAMNIYFLILTLGIIYGSGVGIVYGAIIAAIAKWFPKRKGLAVGLTLGGFGLSPFITAPLANWLISNFGILTAFIILGISFGLIIITLGFPFKFPDSDKTEAEEDSNADDSKNLTTKEMIKTPKFYFLWFCFILGTLIGLMAIRITGPVGRDIIGLSSQTAALFVSFFAIFNGLGRPLFGWLTDRFGTMITIIISYTSILLAGVVMLVNGDGSVVLYAIAFALFWLNLGGWLAIAPAATAQFFGPKHYGKNYGFLFTGYGVGAVIGTSLSGHLRDLLGSYIYVFYPVTALMVFGILLTVLMIKSDKIATR